MTGRLSSWLKTAFGRLPVRADSRVNPRRSWDEMGSGEVRREMRREVRIEAMIEWVDAQDQLVRTAVVIEDESVFGFQIRLGESLPVGRTVWISSKEILGTKAVVRHCRPHGDRFVVGLYQIKSERRRDDRVPMHDTADLAWESGGTRSRSTVIVLDSSADGVQVEVEQALPEETIVKLSFGAWQRFGVTCYCVPKVEKFLVGIHFTGPAHHKTALELRD